MQRLLCTIMLAISTSNRLNGYRFTAVLETLPITTQLLRHAQGATNCVSRIDLKSHHSLPWPHIGRTTGCRAHSANL